MPPRRFRPRSLLAALLLAVALWYAWSQAPPLAPPALPSPPPAGAAAEMEDAVVARTVDGDTLLLSDRQRLRLIGVNAPESVKPDHPVEPWGPEAAEFTRRFVAGGAVRLQFDGDRTDQYGRLLACVWVGDRMLNEELVRAGLARAERQYHFSAELRARLTAAEAEARAARRGIWSAR